MGKYGCMGGSAMVKVLLLPLLRANMDVWEVVLWLKFYWNSKKKKTKKKERKSFIGKNLDEIGLRIKR